MRLRGAPVVLLAVASLAAPASARAEQFVVGTNATPPSFTIRDTADPPTATPVVVTGFATGRALRGLDVRPATGELYVLDDAGQVYRGAIVPGQAVTLATVGPPIDTPPFLGTEFQGFDFNPVVDRIRLVQAGVNSNLRIHPDTGAVTSDTPLSAGDVSALAYAPSQAGAATTTLYGIDHSANTLVRIGGQDGDPSPNGGATTTLGPLGPDVVNPHFDVSTTGKAWASVAITGTPNLAAIDLGTGALTVVGSLGLFHEGLAVLPKGTFTVDPVAPVTEGGTASITVRRSAGLWEAVSVDWALAGVSADAGDLDAATGRLDFAQGEAVRTVAVPTKQDAAQEDSELATFRLTFFLGGAVRGEPSSAGIVIRDDDTPAPAPVTTTTPGPTVTVPVAGAPPPDRTAPVAIGVPPDRIRLPTLRSRGLPLTLMASEASLVTLQLRDGTRVLGTATARFARPSVQRVRVRLTRAGRRALRRAKRLSLRVRAVDAAGNAATRTVGVRVTR